MDDIKKMPRRKFATDLTTEKKKGKVMGTSMSRSRFIGAIKQEVKKKCSKVSSKKELKKRQDNKFIYSDFSSIRCTTGSVFISQFIF